MVKKYFLIVVAILMGSLTEVEAMMAPIVDTKPDVRVIRRTPCHDEFQQSLENGTLVPSIVLTKEGSVLSVELCNYVCDCEVEEFQVESYVSEACVDPPNLIINVEPASTYNADCKCPCNLSFTVNDVDLNIYELTCWWFDGIVELTDGVPLVLLKDHEVPTIMGDVNGDGNVNSRRAEDLPTDGNGCNGNNQPRGRYEQRQQYKQCRHPAPLFHHGWEPIPLHPHVL